MNQVERMRERRKSLKDAVNWYIGFFHCADCGNSDPRVLTVENEQEIKRKINDGVSFIQFFSRIAQENILCANCKLIRESKRKE